MLNNIQQKKIELELPSHDNFKTNFEKRENDLYTTEHSKHDVSRSYLKSDGSDLNLTTKFDKQIPDVRFDLGPFTRF